MNSAFFSNIFRRALTITRRNRFLWWYGFLISLGSITQNSYYESDKESTTVSSTQQDLSHFVSSLQDNWSLALLIVILIITLLLVLYIFNVLSLTSIWLYVAKCKNTSIDGTFKKGFSKAKKYFWQIFLARLLFGAILAFILLLLMLPSIYLWINNDLVSSSICMFIAFGIFMPILALFIFVRKYSQFYIILSDLTILDAFDAASTLLRKNLFKSILFGCCLIGWNIVFMMLLVIGLLIIVLVGMALAAILYFLKSTIGLTLVIIVGIILAILLTFYMRSVFIVFLETAWVLFFKKIASQKDRGPVEECETITTPALQEPKGVQISGH